MIFNYKRMAKANSFKQNYIRTFDLVKGIVLHYTDNRGDTAKNNADFFATGNTRAAGAHIFIDREGKAALSVPLKYVAWSVGDHANGEGRLYYTLNNYNTISIELCDIVDRSISEKQYKKLRQVVKYIAKKCPNVSYVCRHYDITTKVCPAYYVTRNREWLTLQRQLLDIVNKVHKEV